MHNTIDVKGASGAVYRFIRQREEGPLSPMGGNFIYACEREDGCEILYVGEAFSLHSGARLDWEEAVRSHGATHLFTRLNVTERVRQAEQADILAALRPPMNQARDRGAEAAAG